MRTLYIIGNGFDLWHGLPTSYRHFYLFAQNILDELEEYYIFNPGSDIPWYDFENVLGTFNADGFYDYHNEIDISAEDFRPSFVFSLEDELAEASERHVETIKDAFIAWIDQIDETQATKKMQFNENAFFINFNYTSTLQSVYHIEDKDVLHIHGCAKKHQDLIFGHGEEITSTPEVDENGDSNRTMFSDAESAAKYPLYAFKKPVNEIIKTLPAHFEILRDVTEVIIIGHSLNKIDLPYFARISERVTSAKWNIACYTESDMTKHTQALISCGVSQDKINVISYDDL